MMTRGDPMSRKNNSASPPKILSASECDAMIADTEAKLEKARKDVTEYERKILELQEKKAYAEAAEYMMICQKAGISKEQLLVILGVESP